jgi:hypothetical protein
MVKNVQLDKLLSLIVMKATAAQALDGNDYCHTMCEQRILPSMSHPIGITKASRDLIKIAKEGQGQTI